jgi:hypothetical protein
VLRFGRVKGDEFAERSILLFCSFNGADMEGRELFLKAVCSLRRRYAESRYAEGVGRFERWRRHAIEWKVSSEFPSERVY